jgi:ATP-dependent 26S proteasome regulatory subunit
MPRTSDEIHELLLLDERWRQAGDPLDLDQKLEWLDRIREESPELVSHLQRFLMMKIREIHLGVAKAQEHQAQLQAELKDLINRFSSTPWFPAIFLGHVETLHGSRAMVMTGGNSRRVVQLEKNMLGQPLAAGEEVFLDQNLNLVMAKAPYGFPSCGETGLFERRTADGRIVLRCRDEEVVVEVAAPLKDCPLNRGDQLRWDRMVWMAFEKLDRQEGRHFILQQIHDVERDRVGGQETGLKKLLEALTAALANPDKAMQYGISRQRSILMVGPPGCGKTLMARIAAAEVQRRSGQQCHFAVVKPAEWETPWVGETQQNIRACFTALREAAKTGIAILFLDEIEAIGRIRGRGVDQHNDKALAALLAELDGFADRQGIAIIAATNRTDLVDPALLERLSDVEIRVDRPSQDAARAIFRIHLPDTLPWSQNGKEAAMTQQNMIEVAVSRLYSPNAGTELCSLKFRDGKTRAVQARELVSGRFITQICNAVKHSAYHRDLRGDEPGIRVEDMEEAITDGVERLANTLTRHNVGAYIADLPQDMDVVSVNPISRRIKRPHRYVTAPEHIATQEMPTP